MLKQQSNICTVYIWEYRACQRKNWQPFPLVNNTRNHLRYRELFIIYCFSKLLFFLIKCKIAYYVQKIIVYSIWLPSYCKFMCVILAGGLLRADRTGPYLQLSLFIVPYFTVLFFTLFCSKIWYAPYVHNWSALYGHYSRPSVSASRKVYNMSTNKVCFLQKQPAKRVKMQVVKDSKIKWSVCFPSTYQTIKDCITLCPINCIRFSAWCKFPKIRLHKCPLEYSACSTIPWKVRMTPYYTLFFRYPDVFSFFRKNIPKKCHPLPSGQIMFWNTMANKFV